MELIKIIAAKHIQDYTLQLTFSNQLEQKVDLKEKLFNDHRDIFKELQDIHKFKEIYLDGWTVCWKNGADLAPEFLYELAVQQNTKTTIS